MSTDDPKPVEHRIRLVFGSGTPRPKTVFNFGGRFDALLSAVIWVALICLLMFVGSFITLAAGTGGPVVILLAVIAFVVWGASRK